MSFFDSEDSMGGVDGWMVKLQPPSMANFCCDWYINTINDVVIVQKWGFTYEKFVAEVHEWVCWIRLKV